MMATLRNWLRNAEDALDLMWTEPLSWLVVAGAVFWIAFEMWRGGRLQPVRVLAMIGLGVWLVAALAMTIYPLNLEAPSADRFELQSIVPLWGTAEAIADADGYIMSEAVWLARRQELALEMGVPLEEVNLDRRVHGPGLSVVLKDPIGNMVLFVPLGFVAAAGWRRMRTVGRVLFTGVAISAGIELSQALFGLGSLGTVDDVIFNALGAAAGLMLWRLASSAAGAVLRHADVATATR